MSKYDIDDDEIHWSDDEERLFDSPAPANNAKPPADAPKSQTKSRPAPVPTQLDAEEAREAALQHELENVRKINVVIEGVIESLEKAKGNMETVSHTVTSASTLLTTWSRILSQTEHNQRLILNPSWTGATADLSSIEAEEAERIRAQQRRQMEEQARREAAARKAEEEERKRAEGVARGGAARGGTRGRGVGRGRVASSSGYGQARPGSGARGGSAGASSASRTGTGTAGAGRGARGRARGTT